MCHCGNTGVEQTLNKSQHTKFTLEKKILYCSCRDLNSQTFNHKSSTLPTCNPSNTCTTWKWTHFLWFTWTRSCATKKEDMKHKNTQKCRCLYCCTFYSNFPLSYNCVTLLVYEQEHGSVLRTCKRFSGHYYSFTCHFSTGAQSTTFV